MYFYVCVSLMCMCFLLFHKNCYQQDDLESKYTKDKVKFFSISILRGFFKRFIRIEKNLLKIILHKYNSASQPDVIGVRKDFWLNC